MAIIKFGATVTGLRGTIGGITFTANAAGSYAKAWRMPTYKTSTVLSECRAALARYGPTWRALTPAQRVLWDTWAADPAQARTNSLGETYYMTGFQAYASINQCRDTVSAAMTPTPPTNPAPSVPAPSAVFCYKTGGSAATGIQYSAGHFSGLYGVVFMALVNSIGVLDRAPSWRYIDSWYGGAGDTGHWFQAEAEDAFGTIRVGQRAIFAVYKQIGQGYRSSAYSHAENVLP